MSAVDAPAGTAAPSLDAMLSAQTVWRAGRAPAAAAGGESTGHAALDALLPQRGWPRRALTELLLPGDGVGELSLLLPTLARMTQAGAVVAVVAPPYLPYAPAWQAAGVDLRRLEIVEADPRGALWAFEQCLRSAACAAVLGWPAQADAQALRRLQVAADSGDCLGFAFRDRRHGANPSPAALRLEHAGGAWRVRKCRGGNVPAEAFVPAAGQAAPLVRHLRTDEPSTIPPRHPCADAGARPTAAAGEARSPRVPAGAEMTDAGHGQAARPAPAGHCRGGESPSTPDVHSGAVEATAPPRPVLRPGGDRVPLIDAGQGPRAVHPTGRRKAIPAFAAMAVEAASVVHPAPAR